MRDFDVDFGTYVFTSEIQNDCETWMPGPTATVQVVPTCYDDSPESAERTLTGTGVEYFADVDGYGVKKDEENTIEITGVSDFSSNYTINYSDAGDKIADDGNQFTTLIGLGKFVVAFDKKAGRSACPDLDPMLVFVGGRDEILTNDCPVILPDDLGHFDYPPASIVLEHFAVTVKTNSYIEVKPGVTLDFGAELVLLPGAVASHNLEMNYVETRSYDEYGRPLAVSRAFSDDLGRPIQLQTKDLSAGLVLTSQTIFDAEGRPAISTLAAPTGVRSSVPLEGPEGKRYCPEVGENGLSFAFAEDFVKNVGGTDYTHLNFDATEKENDPDPVANTTEGTLGWYYSTNNGDAGTGFEDMNEPLTPVTSYPYSRTLWHHDGSGAVKGTTMPGDVFKAGSGKLAESNTAKVLSNDTELADYLEVYSEVLDAPTDLEDQFFQTIAFDADGNKSIVYSDKSGNALISLYFGTGSTPISRSYGIYDHLNRLIVSIPPNGVSAYNGSNYSTIEKTTYTYNHKGWLLSKTEPDAGTTEYIYRKDGKIRFSRDADQASKSYPYYSYTNYDRLGRPIESGEYRPGGSGTAFNRSTMTSILENVTSTGGLLPQGERHFQTFTIYDIPAADITGDADATILVGTGRIQRFVHGAVSCSRNENSTSWYSYDEQGRAEWMVQILKDSDLPPDKRVKTLDYRYGPTGAVQEVVYQKNVADERFTHFYEYDYNGRLVKTYTTTDLLEYNINGIVTNASSLTLQATNYYYKHGPLKRIEYTNSDHELVQGIDYIYTITGALKAINDADKTNSPVDEETDVFGMTLDYYSGDYASHGHTPSTATYGSGVVDSFTGLIKGNRWHSPIDDHLTVGYGYSYDSRKQFESAKWTNAISGVTDPYKESIGSYDLNGNIQTLNRKNSHGTTIADFVYGYESNRNRLTTITTPGGSPTTLRSYEYDLVGRMTKQAQPNLDPDKELNVTYDAADRVTEVKNESNELVTKYAYDDRGFRLSKTNYNAEGDPKLKTWYVRDAIGSVIASYDKVLEGSDKPTVLTEFPIYSGNRMGMYKPQFHMTFYELNDHLGNVRAVIGDNIVAEYMATMEDERVLEGKEDDFNGITPETISSYVNHTPSSVTVDGVTDVISSPANVIRINNGITQQPIGGGIMLAVHPGDMIDASVYAKYENFDSGENNLPVTGIASFLATTFGAQHVVIDAVNIFHGLDETPAGVFA
ncbi:MAG TPA: hypothetical protein VFE50_16360, partial [Cyclobacteriaceae bacterium]|nr:hypothetical protein [Cyclobacteriaceae bacterium]